MTATRSEQSFRMIWTAQFPDSSLNLRAQGS
jgi:hypothetical protein